MGRKARLKRERAPLSPGRLFEHGPLTFEHYRSWRWGVRLAAWAAAVMTPLVPVVCMLRAPAEWPWTLALAALLAACCAYFFFFDRRLGETVKASPEGITWSLPTGQRTHLRWTDVGDIRDDRRCGRVDVISRDGKTVIQIDDWLRNRGLLLEVIRVMTGRPGRRQGFTS